MGSLAFDCEWCGRGYEVAPDMAGQAFHCRNCGGETAVPATAAPAVGTPIGGPVRAAPPPQRVAPKPTPQPRLQPCPFCGEGIAPGAYKCGHCGSTLRAGAGAGAVTRTGGASPADMTNAANLSLALGVLGWFVCALLGPIAIIKGNEARRLAYEYGVEPPGTATAGLVLGWLLTIGMLVGVLFMLFAFAVAALA